MKMQMAWSRPLAFRQILADIQNAACAQQHTAAAEFYFKQQHFSSGPVSFLRRRQSPSFFFYVCILPLSFFFIFFFLHLRSMQFGAAEKNEHTDKSHQPSRYVYIQSASVHTKVETCKRIRMRSNS